jgi:hypothetical protein
MRLFYKQVTGTLRAASQEERNSFMIQINHIFEPVLNKHYGCPQGMMGRFVGELMVRQHAKETAWTVSIADVQPADCVLEIGFGAGKGHPTAR